jgi:hypothetical protein
MFRKHLVVFNEQVPSTTTVYSQDSFHDDLGTCDQLAIHCLVENQNAAGGIRVQLEHSGDGRHWLPKYAGNGEIGGTGNVPAPSAGVANLAGFDQGATPSFRFVRLAITLVAPCTSARVRITVTCRDAA